MDPLGTAVAVQGWELFQDLGTSQARRDGAKGRGQSGRDIP